MADEMDATTFRSAFNPIIAEVHDASHGICDAVTGETLIQGKSSLPIFVGVMAVAVHAFAEGDGGRRVMNDRTAVIGRWPWTRAKSCAPAC